MSTPRFSRARALLLAALLAVGAGSAIVATRTPRAPRIDAAPVAKAAATSLRVERVDRVARMQAPKPLALARPKAAKAGAAAVREPKVVVPLDDSPAAHEIAPPEARTPGAARTLFGRDEILKERDGVTGFSTSRYGATFGKGSIELALPIPLKKSEQPRLAYEFVELRAGAATIASGGEATARVLSEERAVAYDRGSVEERYVLRPDALEQTFIVRALPAGAGALTVTGRVSTNLTPPENGATGPKLAFKGQGSEVLTISEAVAVDAGGRRQPLELAYADGLVSMTVPAEWVAAATLPIVIDPLMGGPVAIDSSVTDAVGLVQGVPVRICDVAYNSTANEWLVVWQEQFGASAFNYDVYAQRISATGTPVGSAIPVSATDAGEYEPAVSWDSVNNRYLIAWRQDPADDASDADQFIAGAVLSADGTVFASPFVLDDAAGQDFGPTLVFDGANWLCVYTNVVSATDTNVLARFVSPGGVPGTAVTLDADADLAAAPSVDVTGGTYLIAWQKGAAGAPASIVARTMDASGAFLAPLKNVDQSALNCVHPDVGAGGGMFLIVWQQELSATDHNVVGRRATTSLTFPSNAKNIRATVSDQLSPRTSFSTTSGWWYVVYSDGVNGNPDIYANRMDLTGKVYGANRLTSDPVAELKPELAWNSATDEMLVTSLAGAASPFQIRAQRVSMDFVAPTVPGTPVATPNPNATGAAIVTWAASVESGSGFSNYDLQRSADGGAKWNLIASPTTETYADSVPQGEYLYRVRAKDLAGNLSAWSPVSAVLFVDNAAPAEALSLQQYRADGTTPIVVEGTIADAGVVFTATVHDLGLLDGFEDRDITTGPMWTAALGTWGVSLDGTRVLHDGAGLDDLIYTPSTQTSGAWEYRFRWPTIGAAATVNLQASFYPFLDSLGLGGNGYQVLVTAGAASSKTVSLYRVDGASSTQLIGVNANWTPNTSFHVVRLNRSAAGQFDLMFDGVLVGSAVDATHNTAVATLIRNMTTNGNTLRVDHIRMSSSAVARSTAKLQIEVKPVATAFDGTGLVESALVASGSIVSVPVSLVNASYHWRARVVDALGNAGPFSSFGGNAETAADLVVNVVPPPPAPTGLVATPGNGQVGLQWSASSGATGYTVKRSPTSGGPYGIVAQNVPSTLFTDSGLQNGTTYFYVVSATNSGGESSNSNEASATPLPPPPAPPTGLVAQAGGAQIFLTWNVTATATSYNLKRATTPGGPYSTIQPGLTGTSAIDSGLTNGTAYYYVVAGVNAGGEGGNSNEASATPIAAPGAPTNLVASPQNTQVLLTWNASPGAVSYTVKRGLASGGPFTPVTSGLTLTTYTDGGLSNGTTYFYVVTATNVGGESLNSNEAFAIPTGSQDAPTNLVAVPGNARIVLTWSPVNGATGYSVRRSVKAGGPYVAVASAAGPSHTDLGLTNGVAYYYVVRALIGASESGDSNEASARPTLGAAAPANLSLKAGNGQVTLTWTESATATSYRIKRSLTAGGPYAEIGSTSTAGYVDSSVTNGVAYYYVVTAMNAGGESPNSAEVAGIPSSGPTSLIAIPDGLTNILLSWFPATGPGLAGYNVYRSGSAAGPFAKLNIALVTGTTYTNSGVANGDYFYVVRSLDTSGRETGESNVASATAHTSPIVFYGIGATADSIDWTWEGPFDPSWTGFVLHDDHDTEIARVDLPVAHFIETGLAENTQVRHHIHPITPTGLGQSRALSSAYSRVHDPLDSDFTISAAIPGEVSFTVVPPPNATKDWTGVQFYRSTNGINFSREDYYKGTYTFIDPFVAPNTVYYYKIEYINGDFTESNLSPARMIKTSPLPSFFSGAPLSTTTIRWSWETVPGTLGYELHDEAENAISTSLTFFNQDDLTENAPSTRHLHVRLPEGLSGPTESLTLYTLVHTPTTADFSLAVIGPTSIQVTVVSPIGAGVGSTGCEIQRSLNNSSWTTVKFNNPSTPGYSFTDAGVAPGTLYYYRIRLANGNGRFGVFSPSASIQTPPGPPPAPTVFAGAAVGTTQIHWTWADVPGATGFVIHNDAHQEITPPLGPGVLAFDEPSLSENARVSRHVHSLGSGGFAGLASSSAAVYTLVHPAQTIDFVVNVISRNRIDLTVFSPPSPSSGQTGCEIQELVGGTWATVRPFSSGYLFSHTGLDPGSTHEYRIQFRNGDGTPSGVSASQSATTFNLLPPVITTPSKRVRIATPTVAGTASPGETVTLYFANVADGTAVAGASGAWVYTATPKAQGFYQVVAYGSSSGYSNSITIQVDLTPAVPPAPPTNLRAKVYASVADVEWDPSVSPNVTGYNVYRKLGPDGTWTLLNTTGVVLNTRYRDSALTTGQNYVYRVTAVDNSGNE